MVGWSEGCLRSKEVEGSGMRYGRRVKHVAAVEETDPGRSVSLVTSGVENNTAIG
jgi:hypothetical protein